MERFYSDLTCLEFKGHLYLDGYLVLKVWNVFCYYITEYVFYSFSLYLISFNDCDS
jgi:hypothetical protein